MRKFIVHTYSCKMIRIVLIGVLKWPILDGKESLHRLEVQFDSRSRGCGWTMQMFEIVLLLLQLRNLSPNPSHSMISVASEAMSSVSWEDSEPWGFAIMIPWWWAHPDDDDYRPAPVALWNDLVMFLVNLLIPGTQRQRQKLDCTI